MAQQNGASFPIRLEQVPTPPPFDLSRQPRTTEMPATPPAPVEPAGIAPQAGTPATAPDNPVEKPADAPFFTIKSVENPVTPPVDKSMANPSGGMWRGRNTLDSMQKDSFSIPFTRTEKTVGKDGTQATENAAPVSTGTANFSELKPGGKTRVKAVITPLTLQLGNGKTLQLSGIDIPGLDPYRPGEIALAAQQALESLVAGKELSLHVSRNQNRGRTNRLGHLLAQAEIAADKSNPPLWIQGALLEKGLARARTDGDNPEMAAQMLALESKARAAGLGLWADPANAILSPGAAEDKIGSFQIVEGTILDVATVRSTIYLNFGRNWRTDFSGGIGPDGRIAFARAGMKPMEWQGKRVRLRGFVEDRNGPYIAIDSPGQIEFPDGSSTSTPSTAGTATLRPKPMYSLRHIDVQPPKIPPVQRTETSKTTTPSQEEGQK